jgi:hypothetical protein
VRVCVYVGVSVCVPPPHSWHKWRSLPPLSLCVCLCGRVCACARVCVDTCLCSSLFLCSLAILSCVRRMRVEKDGAFDCIRCFTHELSG